MLQHCQHPRCYVPTSQYNSPIPPDHQNETHVPLRNGTAGVLGIFALLKLGRFAFRVRDRTRLIQNRQVYVFLCHLVVFVGVMSGLTADATDPLRAFESLTPCFLVNATGTTYCPLSRFFVSARRRPWAEAASLRSTQKASRSSVLRHLISDQFFSSDEVSLPSRLSST